MLYLPCAFLEVPVGSLYGCLQKTILMPRCIHCQDDSFGWSPDRLSLSSTHVYALRIVCDL
jgi:hypothetical protein